MFEHEDKDIDWRKYIIWSVYMLLSTQTCRFFYHLRYMCSWGVSQGNVVSTLNVDSNFDFRWRRPISIFNIETTSNFDLGLVNSFQHRFNVDVRCCFNVYSTLVWLLGYQSPRRTWELNQLEVTNNWQNCCRPVLLMVKMRHRAKFKVYLGPCTLQGTYVFTEQYEHYG